MKGLDSQELAEQIVGMANYVLGKEKCDQTIRRNILMELNAIEELQDLVRHLWAKVAQRDDDLEPSANEIKDLLCE